MYNLTIPASTPSMFAGPSSAPATTSQQPFFPHQHSRSRPKLSIAIIPDTVPSRYTGSRRSHSALNPPSQLPEGLLSPTTKNTHFNARRTSVDGYSSASSSSGSEDEDEAEATPVHVKSKGARSTRPRGTVRFVEEVRVIPGEEGVYCVEERWQGRLF